MMFVLLQNNMRRLVTIRAYHFAMILEQYALVPAAIVRGEACVSPPYFFFVHMRECLHASRVTCSYMLL